MIYTIYGTETNIYDTEKIEAGNEREARAIYEQKIDGGDVEISRSERFKLHVKV